MNTDFILAVAFLTAFLFLGICVMVANERIKRDQRNYERDQIRRKIRESEWTNRRYK